MTDPTWPKIIEPIDLTSDEWFALVGRVVSVPAVSSRVIDHGVVARLVATIFVLVAKLELPPNHYDRIGMATTRKAVEELAAVRETLAKLEYAATQALRNGTSRDEGELSAVLDGLALGKFPR